MKYKEIQEYMQHFRGLWLVSLAPDEPRRSQVDFNYMRLGR